MTRTHTLLLAACCTLVLHAADTITLDLLQPTWPPTIELTADSTHWAETYNADEAMQQLEFGLFSFTHNLGLTSTVDESTGMSLWNGFTYCLGGDSANYGQAGSSEGWISHQWGCMAGGGIARDAHGRALLAADGRVLTDKHMPYLVGFWSFNSEGTMNNHSLQINFTDSLPHRVLGTYVCNHPWPYYGNLHGDGFASPLEADGDFFRLVAHGLDANGDDTGSSVELNLAEVVGDSLHQRPGWQWMDLSPLGRVSGIYFTMLGSDMNPLVGLNTAAYFCMDLLQVLSYEEVSNPDRPTLLRAEGVGEDTICISWNHAARAYIYNVYCDTTLLANTTDTCFTLRGLRALTTYSVSVEAQSQDGLLSDRATLSVTTLDLTAPTAPTSLQAEAEVYTIRLTWEAAEDNVAVDRYTVYLDGTAYSRVRTTACTITGLDPATDYLLEVEAADASGNRSDRAALRVTTLAAAGLEEHPAPTLTAAPVRVYTPSGTYVGSSVPRQKGVYVIHQGSGRNLVIRN